MSMVGYISTSYCLVLFPTLAAAVATVNCCCQSHAETQLSQEEKVWYCKPESLGLQKYRSLVLVINQNYCKLGKVWC